MKTRLTAFADNLDILKNMRESLIDKDEREAANKERWGTFGEVSECIDQACEEQDLSQLVVHVRRMKNLLRRPSVRKDLAKLGEAEDKGKEKKKEGQCSCAQCGKVIDGSLDPCTEGSLCVDCAMKKRQSPPGENKKEKTTKKAKKGTAFPPEMMGMGGAPPPAGGEVEPPPEREPPPEKEKPPKKPVQVEPEAGGKKKRTKSKKNKNNKKKKKQGFERTESRLRRRNLRRFDSDDWSFDKQWT